MKDFVVRANSEADADPALDPEQEPSTVTDPAILKESPTMGVAGTGSATQIGAHPRVSRRAQPNVSPEDRRDPGQGLRFKVYDRDKSRCQVCGRGPPANDPACKLHLDHIVPFSKGGKTTFENLRVLCSDCNIGRGNRFED